MRPGSHTHGQSLADLLKNPSPFGALLRVSGCAPVGCGTLCSKTMGESQQILPPTEPPAPDTSVPVLTPQQALEMRVRIAERAHDTETAFGAATNAAAVKNAEEAIKAALLVNGGSSVAMLAFLGTLVSQHVLSSEQLGNAVKPLLYFGSGVAAAIIASAGAYFTNLLIAGMSNHKERSYVEPFIRPTPSSQRHVRRAEACRWFSIIAVTASIGCFIWGLASAGISFSNLTPVRPMAATTDSMPAAH
jgi:hypothetical protein